MLCDPLRPSFSPIHPAHYSDVRKAYKVWGRIVFFADDNYDMLFAHSVVEGKIAAESEDEKM